jgi:hypothetical protein
MKGHQFMVIAQRRNHGDADEEHGQKHRRHQPMKDAR